MDLTRIYTGVILQFTPKFLYIFYLTINLNTLVYIDHNFLYSMQNKETNPTVVANDDKKEEPKKEETAKTEK